VKKLRVQYLQKLIGNTPVVELKRVRTGRIFVKLEYMNPTGSHKDRTAYYMIKDAMDKGKLCDGGLVVEASSGNTAISVAWISSIMNLKTFFCVEEDISPCTLSMLESLGAKVAKMKKRPPSDPGHYLNVADRIARERGGVFLNQFTNEANVRAHYETTARELYGQVGGKVDAFVMGVGTGGTISGVGKFLREKLGQKVKIIGVVPKGSPVTLGESSIGEPIPGLATMTVSEIYKRHKDIVDNVVEVSSKEALKAMKEMIKHEGIMGGPSTGANINVALKISEELGKDAVIATLACDSVFRYTHLL